MRIARGLVFVSVIFATAAGAAPSGGPYGPIDQVYRIPKAPHVYYVAPNGKADAAGTALARPTTLEAAVAKAVTGDAIILRGGIYRTGSIVFNQKIVLQPYGGEHPILKGTEIATDWQPAGDNVWKTKWTKLFPAAPLAWWNRAREEAKTPVHRFNNDMVFVDGAFLQSAGSVGEVTPATYYIDYAAGEVYVGADPARHTIEITAHDGALIRTPQAVNGKLNDRQGAVIRGLTITQYARRCLEVEGKKRFGPNDEPTDDPVGKADASSFGKEVTGTVLENLTVSYCSRVGGWFRGDGLVIRNSLFSDTSTEGIYVIGSSNVLIERTVVRRNNIEQLTGYYPGAVKIFNQTHHVVFRDNIVTDQPNSNGVWFDVGNYDAVFVNNYVQGAQVGFFMEISNGALVAGNVFVRDGRGVWALNSKNVRVWNNTFVDTPATASRDGRRPTGDVFAWHSSTGPDVPERAGHEFVNNLMLASEPFREPLLRIEQAPALCGKVTVPQAARIDGNVYVRAGASDAPLVRLSPADGPECAANYGTLAAVRAATSFEAKGRFIDHAPGSVLKAPDFTRFEPRQPIPAAVATPPDVLQAMGWKTGGSVGAYPAGK